MTVGLSDAHETIIRVITGTLPVPNAWAATFGYPIGVSYWRAQADNGSFDPAYSELYDDEPDEPDDEDCDDEGYTE